MNKKRIILFIIIATIVSAIYYWPNRWRYIVIHHSAGSYGNIEFLQKVHRERQAGDPIDAIPYHYIIGNGNGMDDGEIASDFRQKYHLPGAHVSGRNPDKNIRGLGICIIGNLEKGKMTSAQYKSLVKLTNELMDKYSIPADNVMFHGKIKGESTLCPGKYFPFEKFLKEIRENRLKEKN